MSRNEKLEKLLALRIAMIHEFNIDISNNKAEEHLNDMMKSIGSKYLHDEKYE